MEENNNKTTTKTEGVTKGGLTFFRNSFSIALKVNQNVVARKYFQVPDYRLDALESEDFTCKCQEIASAIYKDLVRKSRIYEHYTREDEPIKLTGFIKELPAEITDPDTRLHDMYLICNSSIGGDVVLSNGQVIHKTYLRVPPAVKEVEVVEKDDKQTDENVRMSFIITCKNRVVYEQMLNAEALQWYIRNNVDLSNSDEAYADKELHQLNFSLSLLRHLNEEGENLIAWSVKELTDLLSGANVEESDGESYNRYLEYGDKSYFCSTYNKDYISGWYEATKQKTKEYNRWLNHDYTPRQIERFNHL